MTTTTETKSGAGPRVALQKVGTSLSNMVMPNIPALIAWGILTAFFIPEGWTPNEPLAAAVGPMIHYLLPLLIANTGGRMVYEARGAVVGVIATMGVIAGSDWLIDQENAAELGKWLAAGNAESAFEALPQVHMFIGAMIMAPLAAWIMKKLDRLWQDHIPAGFEMLVNMFSAGIVGFALLVAGFFGLAPLVNGLMSLLASGVAGLVNAGLLPLVSLLIEPAKVFFLNNAINHGVLTPLGISQAATDGKSVLFLLESNPGPGVGILLAYTVFGRGAARASAPGAAIIQFFGGIHEIYFPYVLMKPILILAAIGGGMTGVAINVAFGTGLISAAAPGSIIAIFGVAARDSYLGIALAVLGAATVSFLLAALFLKIGKQDDGDIASATAKMEQMKGKKSSVAGALTGAAGAAGAGAAAAADASGHTGPIRKIVFACDAGMGSSAMGATVLRKKVRAAGFDDVEVTNKAISSLNDEWDVVVTQKELTDRARQRTGSAVHVSVDQFMNSPRYDEVVELVGQRNAPDDADDTSAEAAATTGAGAGAAAAAPSADDAPRGRHAAPRPEDEQPAEAEGTAGTEAAAEDSTDSAPQILAPSSIVLDGTATDSASGIDEAGALLVAAGAVDEGYVRAMHDREATVSTFMGNGLAIPHGTNEAKSSITRSAMSFVRYPNGIDWNGNPTTFVIGIAGVGNEHLTLLQKVAMTFSDPAQVKRLEDATTTDEILEILGDEKE
ncbi:PTS system D-mannitol-specific IIA component (Fru family) /PTS system D-mannitol-specific IIB component (Fru family) /PTS system D-mannitol-specific IIC component (Fru family) [Brachybacterium sp. AG952]|uniref:PTS sugar transporter subunit IIA n=1 Tax=Brachybacterium sp. AG952 TaxID=2183989 RepID=UPI001060AF16|nr:PTS sugar transporter subunit IIA [Brachybacterium sp. AG952]TDP79124.1 PTS system D-mannitol-specific IIA component (Fru family) /PTS system D-mannitol-specific IIB component (Fru family) /PTS system D-mannitol-specific IIC component (Fru family) [Brachybacterium sp. AG952]